MSEIKARDLSEDRLDAADDDSEDQEAIDARKAFDADDEDEVEAEAEVVTGGKGNRKHGRSFIYLSLEDAENAVRKVDEHERRMSKTSFAQALGHPKPIGRFKQKLAALESYGLIQQDAQNIRLTDLAVEMLYGPTEQARTRAKAKAFLTYDLFKETFVQCPKGQDHQMSYVDDFVRVTLKIVNEREMFLKRFLESAKYAGLLEGEPDPKSAIIRLRAAVVAPGNGDSSAATKPVAVEDQWVMVAPDDVGSLLDGLGLTAYHDRCDVTQKSTGDVAINMAAGKIIVEVNRPSRVSIKTSNTLADVTEILRALQAKGFKA